MDFLRFYFPFFFLHWLMGYIRASPSVTPRQLCYQHIPYFFLRISSKLGFTIINSIVDFVDSVENDSKKEGKEN